MTQYLQHWARVALSMDGLLWFYVASVVGIYWTTRIRMKLWIPTLVLFGSLITFVVAATRPFTGFDDSAPLVMMGAMLMAAASMAVLYVGWFQQELTKKREARKPAPRRTPVARPESSKAEAGLPSTIAERHWTAARPSLTPGGTPLPPWAG